MGELGFASRSLWLLVVGADGIAVPVLNEVERLPLRPGAGLADDVVRRAARLRHEVAPRGSVALLLARPGDDLDETDRAWAVALSAAAQSVGLSLWPLHVATDRVLRVVAPDDLAQASIELMSP